VAGLNSLGIGGTNAFAILAEAGDGRASDAPGPEAGEYVICLSARSPDQLRRYLERMAAFAERHPELPLREFCYTVNVSRSHHRVRCCGLVGDRAGLTAFFRTALQADLSEPAPVRRTVYVCNPAVTADRETVEALTGDARFPAFRARFDEIRTALLDSESASAPGPVLDGYLALAVETALHGQLQAWGIRFDGVVGTGLGGVVAQLVQQPEIDSGELAAARAAVAAAVGAAHPTPDGAPATDRATHTVYRTLPSGEDGEGAAAAHRSWLSSGDARLSPRGVLTFLTQYLAAGGHVDWESYYRPTPTATISLPTYPFSRDRHWLDE
jgi:acyl transferase domain-containing protein